MVLFDIGEENEIALFIEIFQWSNEIPLKSMIIFFPPVCIYNICFDGVSVL